MTTDEKPKNWLGRNWKWLVPAGCLGLVAACAVFVLGILAIVFGAIRSTDIYQQSINVVSSNPQVVEALGAPVKPGFLVGGSVNVNGPSGQADISIPVSGPKGSGTLYVTAEKRGGIWLFSDLTLVVDDTGERIDLLPALP